LYKSVLNMQIQKDEFKELSEVDLLITRIAELEHIIEENAKLVKLRNDIEKIKKKDQTVTNIQNALSTKEISFTLSENNFRDSKQNPH
ncbi:35034_t:CDS:2, partial [Racocetra persica]